MLRGMITFVCDCCGHKFKGMNFEWNATVMSQPLKCPQCGSYHTCPNSFWGGNKIFYRKIWQQIDERHKSSNDLLQTQ